MAGREQTGLAKLPSKVPTVPKSNFEKIFMNNMVHYCMHAQRKTTPSKNELARSCKIVQESCMQDLLGTCTQYVPFLARFLHNLAHILQEMEQDFARDAARIITCKFAHFFARSCKNWCKIVQESCKKRDISRAKQVLHARFLNNLA